MVVLALLAGLVLAAPSFSAADHPLEEGFGATTPGGAGGTVVHVTTLADAGPGSLREALAGGNRIIVFDVAGEILLQSHLHVRGAFVTVDGHTARSPGVTLRNGGLVIRGSDGAHDVIVRGLRIRNSPADNVQIAYGARNVVISHVSSSGAGDGNLDITEGAQDVTVAWTILAEPVSLKSMLVKYGASRVTLHHNLFVESQSRNPSVSIDDAGTRATDTTLDMRNNVVWGWDTGYGTLVHHGARANVVRNYYASPRSSAFDQGEALLVCSGSPTCLGGDPAAFARAFVDGNVDGDGLTARVNGQGTEPAPFSAPAIATADACTAARRVLDGVGPRPLDTRDAGYVTTVVLAGCSTALAATTTTLVSSRNPSTDGELVTFTAAVTPVETAAGTPTGTVDILDGGIVVRTLALVGGQASWGTSKLKPGQHSMTAVYGGDATFAGSTSAALVQKVTGSPAQPRRNKSSVKVTATLDPCCAGEDDEGSGGLVTRAQGERDNKVQRDSLRALVSLALPAAGIVDRATAAAADVRMVLSRDAAPHAECRLAFVQLETEEEDEEESDDDGDGGPSHTVAVYRLEVDLRPDSTGALVLRQSRGHCDVDLTAPGVQPGVPNAIFGDVATVVVGPGDAYVSVLESRFRR